MWTVVESGGEPCLLCDGEYAGKLESVSLATRIASLLNADDAERQTQGEPQWADERDGE